MLYEDEGEKEEGKVRLSFNFMDKTTLTMRKLDGRKRKWYQLYLSWGLALYFAIPVANLL
jgi:hypothetical protein